MNIILHFLSFWFFIIKYSIALYLYYFLIYETRFYIIYNLLNKLLFFLFFSRNIKFNTQQLYKLHNGRNYFLFISVILLILVTFYVK